MCPSVTQLSPAPLSRFTSETASQLGPVLLAAKPFNGLDATVAVARWLAALEERALHVVTILDQGDALAAAAGMPPLPSQFYERERTMIAARIRRELALDGSGDELTPIEVLDAWSARAIVETARSCGARVIVIGMGRHDTMGRFVYGERALEIIAVTDRPVLIVPRDAHAGSVAIAVVAVDFSPASLRAARAAIPMLSDGSRLRLVHVTTTGSRDEDPLGWSDGPAARSAMERFKPFLRQLPSLPGVTVETKFLRGDAAHTIVEYAKSCNAGLIACGRLGHSFVERVLVGSVSSALVRHASCPVLVAPEQPGDSATV